MPRSKIVWSPNRRSQLSVANSRVCLALLRIFREVRLGVPHHFHDDVARPLWPALRVEGRELRGAMRRSEAGPSALRSDALKDADAEIFDDAAIRLPAWLGGAIGEADRLPLETPDDKMLAPLGAALIQDNVAFRPLFDAVERRLERRAAQILPVDRNIGWLAHLLGLSGLEQEVLSLCAAFELGTIERDLLSQVGNTVRCVRALRAATRVSDEQALTTLVAREGELQHSGLLRVTERDDTDLDDLLRLSRLGSLLTTTTFRSVEAMAARVLKPLPPAGAMLSWPHLQQRAELLEQLLRNALRGNETGINILIYGAPGTGKTAFTQQLISEAGALGFAIDDVDDKRRPASRQERLGSLRLCENFAPAGRSVLVLDEAEDIFCSDYGNPLARVMGNRDDSKSWMNHQLENNRIPVIWISNQIGHIDPAYLRRFTYCLEFPIPPRAQRREIANAHLAPVGGSVALVERVAAHPTLPAALLASAARFITLSGAVPEQVDTAAAQMLNEHLRALGQPLQVGVVDAATPFNLAYLNVRGSTQPALMLSGLSKLGRGSVLLSGSPGTGKTQMAAQIAHHLGRDLVYRTAADINSKWYGESERNVAELFTHCDPRGEVLFLDEADTLLGDRSTASQRADRAVTSEFLRRVEAFEGVFVCATNDASFLDSALMRRFVFRLEFLPLTAPQREALLRECLCRFAPGRQPDAIVLLPHQLGRLSQLNQLTPGDFANITKRFEALGLSPTDDAWLDELEAEHQSKPGCQRSAIGFT